MLKGWLIFWFAVTAILIIVVPLGFRHSLCTPDQQKTWSIEGQAKTNNGKYPSQASYYTVKENKPDSNGKNDNASNSYKELLCGEVKITDLALIWFTCGLVIVGYFTMRSNDETTKSERRAYLVGGPPFGIPKDGSDGRTIKHRAQAYMFKGPWRMTIYNFGKTAGYTVKVEWGLCPESEFPTSKKVSELLNRKEFYEWRCKYLQPQVIIQDIINPFIDAPLQYRHVVIEDRDKYIGWIFFGRIIYKDVFGDMHYSTFSYELTPQHHNSIGKSLSDDHGDWKQ